MELWNGDGGPVKKLWWNSGTVMVEKWNRYGRNSRTEMVEQWNNDGGTEEQRWWNSGTEMVEEWNNDGGTEEQL